MMRTAGVAALLLLSAAGPATAGGVRLSSDIGLVGIRGYVAAARTSTPPWLGLFAGGQLARVAVGIETQEGFGLMAGATLAEAGLYEGSVLPVGIKAYWDADPSERWKRRTIYAAATYHHKAYWSDFHWYNSPFVELGAGAAYTFYAVTPKVEVMVRPGSENGPSIRLSVGFDLGGTYVFGRNGGDR